MKKNLISITMVFMLLLVTGVGAIFANPASPSANNINESEMANSPTQSETTVNTETPETKAESETTESTEATTENGTNTKNVQPETLGISPQSVLIGNSVVVENQQDLVDTINGTTEDSVTIKFGENFSSNLISTVSATVKAGKTITIDGEGKTLTSSNVSHFSINIENGGKIVFKDLTIDGGNNDNGGMVFKGGEALLDNFVIKNIKNKIAVVSDGNNKLIVKNSLFDNLKYNGAGHGAGINSNGSLYISNSTFSNISGTAWGGYAGGAIALFRNPAGSVLDIQNTYFVNNTAPKYGGAITLYQASANVNINNSYFENNRAILPASGWYDGGAIGVYNNGQAFDFNIKNSTFDGNTATDDGGAIFVESNHASVKGHLNVENSTFYNNIGQFQGGTGSGTYDRSDGGAVQISLNIEATFKNNTFYKNSATTAGFGGALGVHSDQFIPSYNLINNIFVGNIGKADSSNVYGTVNINVGNVGYDNGTALPQGLSTKSVFGTENPVFDTFGISKIAGREGTSKALKTFMIAPYITNEVGVSAYMAGGSGGTNLDVRGYSRKSTPDSGAVEIQGVKFNSNGGSWSGLSNSDFPSGELFFGTENVLEKFAASSAGTKVAAINGDNLSNADLEFIGWSKDSNGSVDYLAGDLIDLDVKEVFAVWQTRALKFKVEYDGNGADSQSVPNTDYDVVAGSIYSINNSIIPTKTGYTFTGYKDKAGNEYNFINGNFDISNFNMPSNDVLLVAQWSQNKWSVTYDGGAGTTNIPQKSINIGAGDTYTISSQIPENSNLIFNGWTIQGTQMTFGAGGSFIMPDSDVVLIANWSNAPIVYHTVTFLSEGNIFATYNKVADSSKIIAPSENPVRSGYTFDKWNIGDRPWNFENDTVTSDIELIAGWNIIPEVIPNNPINPNLPNTNNNGTPNVEAGGVALADVVVNDIYNDNRVGEEVVNEYINNNTTPLGNVEINEDHWSLFNLIIMIVSILISLTLDSVF